MPESVKKPLIDTLMSGYIGQGPRVEEFESLLSKWIRNSNVLTVNAGTSALHLAYHMIIENSGDEIITTPMTCTATNTPIVNTKGGKIVWADVDPYTGLIDPDDIEKKITPRTKGIVMVHLGGNPCDIDRINEIAKKHNLKTIEDAAHAFGSTYKGRRLGNNTSDFVMFSFQAIKHLTTIDGGALITKSKDDYKRGKLLRWYGIDREIKSEDLRCEEDVKEAGYKFHMNDVCAVVGVEMMKYVEEIIAKHRANAKFYNDNLKVDYVKESSDGKSAYWMYTIHIKGGRRDEFIRYMKDNGVLVSKVHSRNDTHTMFKDFKAELPGLEEYYKSMCSIPVGWWLAEKECVKIADLVNKF
ncbi:DegT/DnrJ/EryC1/StrS family aminotransferase [Patescibacteria group bacterium]|nr:DegT/DnrJ/EryC1/StrS family aminotransferase [Patescibacteria group bacterium]MBU1889984.1 DegT/DnrJ/EryC1/StrS family aminotransferase [Patescibacteria group bacterium]